MSIKVTDTCGTEVTATFRATGDDAHAPGWGGNWNNFRCSGDGGTKLGYVTYDQFQWQVGWNQGGSCRVYNSECYGCNCHPEWVYYLEGKSVTSGDDYGSGFECRSEGGGVFRPYHIDSGKGGHVTAMGWRQWGCR